MGGKEGEVTALQIWMHESSVVLSGFSQRMWMFNGRRATMIWRVYGRVSTHWIQTYDIEKRVQSYLGVRLIERTDTDSVNLAFYLLFNLVGFDNLSP